MKKPAWIDTWFQHKDVMAVVIIGIIIQAVANSLIHPHDPNPDLTMRWWNLGLLCVSTLLNCWACYRIARIKARHWRWLFMGLLWQFGVLMMLYLPSHSGSKPFTHR